MIVNLQVDTTDAASIEAAFGLLSVMLERARTGDVAAVSASTTQAPAAAAAPAAPAAPAAAPAAPTAPAAPAAPQPPGNVVPMQAAADGVEGLKQRIVQATRSLGERMNEVGGLIGQCATADGTPCTQVSQLSVEQLQWLVAQVEGMTASG